MKTRGKYLEPLHILQYDIFSVCASSLSTQWDLHYKQISIIRISLISVAIIKRTVRHVAGCIYLYGKHEGSFICLASISLAPSLCQGYGMVKSDMIPSLMEHKFYWEEIDSTYKQMYHVMLGNERGKRQDKEVSVFREGLFEDS